MQPLFINFSGKEIVIVGGGAIAARKAAFFTNENAKITFIAPEFIPEIDMLAKTNGYALIKRKAKPSDLLQAFLVILATNDPTTNQILSKATSPNQLVCIADDAKKGNVHFPAVIERGLLQLAITTNGASPTLTKQIKKDLERQYDTTYEAYTEYLYHCRKIIKSLSAPKYEKQELLAGLLAETVRTNVAEQTKIKSQLLKMKENSKQNRPSKR